jgi:hypothetical protein
LLIFAIKVKIYIEGKTIASKTVLVNRVVHKAALQRPGYNCAIIISAASRPVRDTLIPYAASAGSVAPPLPLKDDIRAG